MNFFNLTKRKYKSWLSEETSGLLKLGRAGAIVPSPARDVCLRKFATLLYAFPAEQVVICWQMAGIVPKPLVQDCEARQLHLELNEEETICQYDVPLEGHLLAKNFVEPPVDLPPSDELPDIYREFEEPPAEGSQPEDSSQPESQIFYSDNYL